MYDPGVKTRKVWKEREYRTTKRAWFNPARWFGNKWNTAIQQYQEDVFDYSEHSFYVEQKAELDREYNENVRKLEDKKRLLEEEMSVLLKGSREARKFQIDCESLEREIAELQSEREAKLGKAIKVQLEKAKAYVESIFETLEKDSRTQAIKSFSEKEELLIQKAIDILEGEIKEELEVKTKKLEALKAKMSLAEKDKNERIQKIDDALSALSSLSEKAEAVRLAIESIETDVIKEQ